MSGRNHLIDVARISSMLIVVVFHSLLWQVLLVDGHVQVVPWAPGRVFWAISWVATIIPVFFVAAGYANAVVVDTWRAGGEPYASFLTRRGSRLLGPMTLFLAVCTVVASVAAWAGWPVEASALSRQFAQLLWFAVVYELLLAAAPLAVWLHDRYGAWVMLPMLVGVVVVDAVVRASGDLGLQWLNLAFAWPLAHQWGIAYHRGWFRGWSTRRLLVLLAGAVAVIAVLVFGLGYPPAAVAWADVLVANLLPPTLAIVVLGFAQTCVLGLAERAGVAARPSERATGLVRLANALLLTAYLWHIPAIVVSAGLLVGLSLLLPWAAPVLMNALLLVVVVLVVVVVAVPWIARVEVRLIPRLGPGVPVRGLAEAGYALFAAGTWAAWQFGSVLHPSDPDGTLAVVLFAAGALLLRRATTGTRTAAASPS
ncbi:MAG: acyltransferase family protein [Propionicimonas sp.]|uniref:acyltransferase family protein n=1 Tax=Propionicimonas sp. TaxID=1955623 RepID=UPI003D09C9C7